MRGAPTAGATPAVAGRQSGFTLLEMLLVLAIVAVAIAAIVPTTTRSRHAVELRTAAVQLAARLNTVRAQATRDSSGHSMMIDTAAARYWATGISRPITLPRGIGIGVEGGEVSGAVSSIRFSPDGRSAPARIRLRSGEALVLVSVDGASGLARVEGR